MELVLTDEQKLLRDSAATTGTVMILIGAPVPVLAGIIYDRFHSYDIAFMYVASLTLVATLVASALVPPKKASSP